MFLIVWSLPYGISKAYDFLLTDLHFLPQQWPSSSSFFTHLPSCSPYVWIGIGVFIFFIITFEGAYRYSQKILQDGYSKPNLRSEISKIADRLSAIKINTAKGQDDYANMLIKCSREFFINGITISHSPPTIYTDVKDNVIHDYDRYGMTYDQKLGFLSQLRIDGIIEPNHFENYERFYLSEFGRQVIKYIKQK